MRVKNWDTFQHFKDRDPIWIKLYRKLLDDIEWNNLDPMACKVLIGLWLLASEKNGDLPDVSIISFRLRMSEKVIKTALSQLDHWLDDTLITDCHQDDALEKRREEREKEKETEIYGEFKNVKLGYQEYIKLTEKFGEEKRDRLIESLSGYIASKGKRYRSHYATLLRWKDDARPGGAESSRWSRA